MIKTFSFKFYLNLDKPKGKTLPIYLRIIVDRKKTEISLNKYVYSKDWDTDSQRTKKNVNINEQLSSIENDIYEITKRLQKENKTATAGIIKNLLTKKDTLDASLIDFFESHISRLEKAGELKSGSISRYKDTKAYLIDFLIKEKKLKDILIENIDYKFLSDFDVWMLNQKVNDSKKLERNTINKHHSRFRTIIIRAMKEGYIFKNPYNHLKLNYTPSKRTYLTDEELKKLMTHSLGENKSLIIVRDIFIFSVYTGLRFEDAQQLNINQIIEDKEGKFHINISQEKTNESVVIPLFPQAVELIKKYNNSERKIKGKVLPKISNQKLNSYLKVIADLVGLEKTLSHHVARHTCATTILLSNGVPIEAVGKWLGHNSIKTTQIYAKISNQYLQQIANSIESKL